MEKILTLGMIISAIFSANAFANNNSFTSLVITSNYSGKSISHKVDKNTLSCRSTSNMSMNGGNVIYLKICEFQTSGEKVEITFNETEVIVEKK